MNPHEAFQAAVLDELRAIRRGMTNIAIAVTILAREEHRMAGELDKLEQDVAAEATVIDSAVVLLQGLKAALDAAIASGDMSRVVAVNASIEAKTQELAAAVTANTPAAP